LNPPVPRHAWPDAVTAEGLSKHMGGWLGEPMAYELMKSGVFPTSTFGRMTVVYAVDFFEWLDGNDLYKRFVRESSVMWEGDSIGEVKMRVPRRAKDIRTFEAE